MFIVRKVILHVFLFFRSMESNKENEIYLMLVKLQRKSSQTCGKYVKHLVSSLLSAQQMTIASWGEWFCELTNVVGPGDALRVIIFAMIQSNCEKCEEFTMLLSYAGSQGEPQLIEFSHLKYYQELALAKLIADLTVENFSSEFVALFVRTSLPNDHPSAYLDNGASKTTFEQSVRLLNDALQCGVFSLGNFAPLRESIELTKEWPAKTALTLFEKEFLKSECV